MTSFSITVSAHDETLDFYFALSLPRVAVDAHAVERVGRLHGLDGTTTHAQHMLRGKFKVT